MPRHSLPTIDPQNPNLLILHGYETHYGYALGALARTVCAASLPLLLNDRSKRAILLGGWRLKEAGAVTIAESMELWLLENGVHPEQIAIPRYFHLLNDCMPARDSAEEIVLLRRMLHELRISITEPFTFVACDFHIPRLMRLYSAHGFTGQKPFPATPPSCEEVRRRRTMERFARIIQFFDMGGHGTICHEVRLKRTLKKEGNPLIE